MPYRIQYNALLCSATQCGIKCNGSAKYILLVIVRGTRILSILTHAVVAAKAPETTGTVTVS